MVIFPWKGQLTKDMDLINEDLKNITFSKIKDEVSKISIVNLYKSKELEKIIYKLNADSRKNVMALGNKLNRELDAYLNEVTSTLRSIDRCIFK